MLAGVEAARVLERRARASSGRVVRERLAAGEPFLRAEGTAAALHMAWKVSLNLCDRPVGHRDQDARSWTLTHSEPCMRGAHYAQGMPGVKDPLHEGGPCGGAFPTRLGASETVLVFDHHITFMGGFEAFLEALPALRGRCVKKLFVEAGPDEARRLAEAGVDGIQLDKLPVDDLAAIVPELRTSIASHAHRGGRHHLQNAAAYAACGVDGLATTAPFTAKPIDMSVRMKRAE